MLHFTHGQLAAIGAATARRRRRVIAAWLLRVRDDLALPDATAAEVDAAIDHSISVCTSAGIVGGADIASFAARTLRHGQGHENRPEHAPVRAVLDDPALPGSLKIARIRVLERDARLDGPVAEAPVFGQGHPAKVSTR